MFHLYGLILGFAMVVTILLVEYKAKQIHFSSEIFQQLLVWELVGAILGARIYHVFTDFYLYRTHLLQIFLIWQGGLSIIGALIGGLMALFLYRKFKHPAHFRWQVFADLAVFGIPFGQAIGRLGNYFNQELYGLPSNLPWAIFIDSAHRLPAYQAQSFFHPLFLYEALLMFGFGVWVWWQDWRAHQSNKKYFSIGSGQLFRIYLLYYMVIRFGLDFLRIDKVYFATTILSLNQVILLIGMVVVSWWWWQNRIPIQKSNV